MICALQNTHRTVFHKDPCVVEEFIDIERERKLLLIDQLYREHESMLRRCLLRKLGRQEDAADVLQDVFVRLINLPDLKVLEENPAGYLVRIATNLVLDRYRREVSRKAGAHDSLESYELAADELTPEDVVQSKQVVEQITLAVSAAGTRVAAVVIKSCDEGMTHEEIATELGVTIRTIERDMRKARDKCLALLDVFPGIALLPPISYSTKPG